jgi:hypothetical protein
MPSLHSVKAGKGGICRKCETQMDRFVHPKGWHIKPGRHYYYEYWDMCPACGWMLMEEAAKVFVETTDTRKLPPTLFPIDDLAMSRESTILAERVITNESTIREKRAKILESTSPLERARVAESTKSRERARSHERATSYERATNLERTTVNKRAKPFESTTRSERATDPESTNNEERAKQRESTKNLERDIPFDGPYKKVRK